MVSNLLLTAPYAYCVYQRETSGNGYVPIVGTAPGATSLTVSFEAVKVGPVQTLEYQLPIVATISVNADGSFSDSVLVPGGWYQLTVSGGGMQTVIERVGVGEVFIKFGHSYLDGGHDQSHQIPATDERVITLLDDQATRSYQFGKLTQRVGPANGNPDAWGMFGDLMVKRLGVPVLIYGCAYGGSNLQMNLDVIRGVQNRTLLPPGTSDPNSRQPFAPLEDVLNNYVPKTGLRAILFEHGYNDRGTSKDAYVQMLTEFVNYVRNHWQLGQLPFVMVQEQLSAVTGSLYDIPTAQAQLQFINSFPAIYKGVDFNTSYWLSGVFAVHDHLYGAMIDQFAADFATSLNDSFFSQTTPYLARDVPVSSSVANVVSNAPKTLYPLDWILLILAAIVLVLFYIKRNKQVGLSFLLLALLCLSRLLK